MKRRELIAGMAGLAAASIPVTAQSVTAKDEYFAHEAAILDPECHQYFHGTFHFTVPDGQTWYSLNSWFTRGRYGFGDGDTASAFFHRNLGQHFPLPEGTEMWGTNPSSFMWVAKPDEIIPFDPRYLDGENLYYERIMRLNTLPLHNTGAYRYQGTPNSVPTTQVSFPDDFDRGLIVHVSCHDFCWLLLEGPDGAASNVLNEINDIHEFRITISTRMAFRRDMWTGIRMGRGVTGDDVNRPQTNTGHGCILYHKLPADW